MKKIRKFLALILTMALTVACLPLAVGAVSGAQEPLLFQQGWQIQNPCCD